MTVHVLDTPFQLPTPSPAVVKRERGEIKRLAESLSNIYLPVVRQSLLDLLKEMANVDQQALTVLTVVPTALEFDSIKALRETIIALRDKGAEENKEAIEEIRKELLALLEDSLLKVGQHDQALDNGLVNFKAISFSDTKAFIADLQKEHDKVAAAVAEIEKPLAKLLEQEEATSKLIREVESLNFFDRLKPLVAAVEKLFDIDPKNPLIGSLKAGLAAVSQILGIASGLLKYEHLISLRERLQTSIAGIRQQSAALKARQQELSTKLQQLNALSGFDAPVQSYWQEVNKLHEALTVFLKRNALDDKQDIVELAARFMTQGTQLEEYLHSLRREW